MLKKELHLNNNIYTITFNLENNDLLIFSDNVDKFYLQYYDQIDFKETNSEAIITIHENKFANQPIQLIVPKKLSKLLSLAVYTEGNLTIEYLKLLILVVYATKGNIFFNDGNINFFANLNTTSGNINLQILDSILNYHLNLKSTKGFTEQIKENLPPDYNDTKSHILANSNSGNIRVRFKGKTKK